jgi:G6PDH family F420-dependent oxidoreductase
MAASDLTIGAFLSSEEKGPREILQISDVAADAGFTDQVVSDHFHPWIDAQGHSPFVWTVLGALAERTRGRLGTGVTCPTMRIHPAIIAQAAATTAVLAGGRFFLGVGSGENLNEHVLGDRWPPAPERLSMLEEAVAVMRALWTGDEITHEGRHYRVEDARIYDLPDEPPAVMVSAFGPKAAELAAEIGDGLVTTSPDADTVATYRAAGGEGPVIACTKMCWAPDEAEARRTYASLWPTSGVPGQLSQELRTPGLFEQAVEVVTEDDAVGSTPVGPDPDRHAEALRSFAEAGVDEVYLQQVGPDQEKAYAFLRDDVLPRL